MCSLFSGEAPELATFDDGRYAASSANGNTADWHRVLQAPAVWRSGTHAKGKSRMLHSLSLILSYLIPLNQIKLIFLRTLALY